MAQVAVPRAATQAIDRAVHIHGGDGVTAKIPLAATCAGRRAMRPFDGPDEVRLRAIAKSESYRTSVLPPGR